MKVERMTMSGQVSRQRRMRSIFFSPLAGALHALEHIGVGMLQRHIEVREHQAFSHQRQHLVHMRIGVDIVQAHPGAVLLGHLAHLRDQSSMRVLNRLAVPETVRYLTSTP